MLEGDRKKGRPESFFGPVLTMGRVEGREEREGGEEESEIRTSMPLKRKIAHGP